MTEPVSEGDIPALDEESPGEEADQPTQVADLGGLARRVEFDHQMATDELASDEPTMVGTGETTNSIDIDLDSSDDTGDDAADDAPTAVRDTPGKAGIPTPQVMVANEPPEPPPPLQQQKSWVGALVAPLMVGVGFGFVVLAYLMLTR